MLAGVRRVKEIPLRGRRNAGVLGYLYHAPFANQKIGIRQYKVQGDISI